MCIIVQDDFNTEALEAKKKRNITKHHGRKQRKKQESRQTKTIRQEEREPGSIFFYHFNSGSLVHNYQTRHASFASLSIICIGNSMICSDIWHKYHE